MDRRDFQKDNIKAKGKVIREKAHKVGGEIIDTLPAPGTMTGTGHSFVQGLGRIATSSPFSNFDPARVLSIIPRGFSLPAFGALFLLLGGIVAAVVAFFKFKK